jgi:hypothetical protein
MAGKTMPLMGVRKFRDEFPNLTESVRVIRSTRKGERPQEILGVWTPVRRERVGTAEDGGRSGS